MQAAHLASQVADIRAINSSIQTILVSACQRSLDSMEAASNGFPGQEFALSTRESSNFQFFDGYVERELALATADAQLLQHEHFQMGAMGLARLSPAKAAQLLHARRKQLERTKFRLRTHDPLDDIRWTMAAIRRRKCVQLTKFVLLVDFLQLDAYVDVVVRSVDAVYNHLLRGANAVYVRRLIARDDLVLAFHYTLDVPRNRSEDTRGDESRRSNTTARHATGVVGGDCSSKHALRLSKQEVRRFLRLVMGDKFQVQAARTGSDDAKSAAVWMESKFEALFSTALAKHMDAMRVDTVGFDDLVHVLTADISTQLVLPPFAGRSHCIFQAQPASVSLTSAPDIDSANALDDNAAASRIAAHAVPALAPVPLLQVALQLAPMNAQQEASALRFDPDLNTITDVIKRVVSSFVELFEGVSPLPAHPDLAAIVRFSADMRASILEMSDADATGDPCATSVGELLPKYSSSQDDDSDNNESHPRNNVERLLERLNDAVDYNLLLNLIDELLANTSKAATHVVSCYAEVIAIHARHEQFDFDSIATRFRRDEYSLAAMTKDAVDLNSQVGTTIAGRAR